MDVVAFEKERIAFGVEKMIGRRGSDLRDAPGVGPRQELEDFRRIVELEDDLPDRTAKRGGEFDVEPALSRLSPPERRRYVARDVFLRFAHQLDVAIVGLACRIAPRDQSMIHEHDA